MADTLELAPADDQSSSDEETVKGDRDDNHVADVLEEDEGPHLTPSSVPTIATTSVKNRYRELVDAARDSASDDGSIDAIPRRLNSPIDSLLSIPDDSPSAQVCPVREKEGEAGGTGAPGGC